VPLVPGARLGPYEIIAKVGEGGMGEVWRARDPKLEREVAIKVLPEAFAADAERLARFEREAKVLAQLAHPNIASIFGLEESGGVRALVMELVEGEGLDKLIARGPIPVDEALPIALRVAEALEAAHERGIVHRDLKPANVKVAADGTVKVLDFGLAKAWTDEGGEGDLSLSPTITAHFTRAGTILGTAAYMSPEQARGRPVDARADVWAFGVVLWEMLTGRKLFDGETVTDVLAAILTRQPDPSELPAAVMPEVRRLLRRCLQDDRRHRLHDIADARIVIEEMLSGGPLEEKQAENTEPRRRARGELLAWVLVGGLAAATAGLGAWVWGAPHGDTPPPVLAFVPPPTGTSFRSFGFGAGPVVVSPDGRRLAFSATDHDGDTKIWVRPLAGGKATPLAGTADGSYPFWSGDSRSLGFFADGKLKTVNVDDGAVRELADSPCIDRGGAWSSQNVILFVPQCAGPIEEIAAAGGSPQAVVQPTVESGQLGSPTFLPDGDTLLYTEVTEDWPSASIRRGSLSTGASWLVLQDAYRPEFASGDLLFCRDGKVFGAGFDPSTGKLTGEARPLGEAQAFSASDNGVLAFQGGTSNARLQWFDGSGTALGTIADPEPWVSPKISPDGTRVLAVVWADQSETDDLWSYPAAGGVGTRLTFGPGRKGFSVWSPDGRYIAYSRHEDEAWFICRKRADGSGAEDVISKLDPDVVSAAAIDWSPDGRYLSIDLRRRKGQRWGNWILPLEGSGKLFQPAPVDADQYDGNFSPDGHWLAYFSYETGRPEVFVVPFPATGAKYQISQNGGWAVRWAAGDRLFFLTMGNRLMEADLETSGTSLRVKAIQPLFQLDLPRTNAPLFDLTSDGSRFLVAASTDPAASNSITLLTSWPALVEKQP